MRIGIVTTWYERGAAYVSKQFMGVLQKTDEVYIYARGGDVYAKGDPLWDLPNVKWGKRMNAYYHVYGYSYIDKRDFTGWIKDNKIECVIFNEQRYYQPLVWVRDMGVKCVAYVDYYTEATLPLFDAYDCVICNTKRHAFAMRHHRNVQYLKWGTNIDLYKPKYEQHENVTFFHSAGMAPNRKGTDILIRSFYNCRNRRNGKLFLHSQVNLKKHYPELCSIIDEMLVEGSLEIYEKTVTAPGLYFKGDVYVYPSRLDGIGLTLMEAISSGMPVITINNAPMNEFVEKEFGSVCDVDYFYCRSDAYYWPMSVASDKSLTFLIEQYISSDRLDKMKEAAREYAVRELDFEKNMERLSEILKNIQPSELKDELRKKIKSYDHSQFRLGLYCEGILYALALKIPFIESYINRKK